MNPIAVAEFVSSLFVCIALMGQYDKNNKTPTHKCMMQCLHAIFIYLIIDGLSYSLLDKKYPFALRYVLNLLSYNSGHLTMIFFAEYCRFYIGEKKELNPWLYRIPEIILGLLTVITTILFIQGKLVVFEDEIAVIVYDLPPYLRYVQVLLMLYIPFIAALNRKSIGSKAFWILLLFDIAPIFASIIALFFSVDLTAVLGAASLILVATLLHADERRELLRKEKISAEASNKAKSEFIFNISHDIRTPMNAVIGFTNKAIRHKDDPEILTESLDKLKNSCEYLLGLVNNVLDMARIESGKLELKEEVTHSESAKSTLLEVFSEEASAKGITLHTSYSTTDKYIWSDEVRTNQIVSNLLSNAIKYTDAGGEIWYAVQQVPSERAGYGKYVITVRDTGRGMSSEFVQKVFGAFEREETALNHFEQGTGLGMSIVKSLVNLMGGTIEVQSETGKGTSIVITSYHKIATAEEIADFSARQRLVAEKANVCLKDKRILLVDDNAFNREITVDILQEQGMIIEEAVNGQNAVEIIREKGPEYYYAILMDIQMPVMNGYEATKEIRSLYPDAKLPIIALSANAFSEDRERSLEAGMNEHIAKPIHIEKLISVLSRLSSLS